MVKILIVDDDRNVLKQVIFILESWGYQAESLLESRHLIQLLGSFSPDLILLDINMPGVDGVTLLRQLKVHPDYQTIPVIMLTADEDSATLANCFEAGAVDYITKPIDQIVMKARINSSLAIREYINKLEEEITKRKQAPRSIAEKRGKLEINC